MKRLGLLALAACAASASHGQLVAHCARRATAQPAQATTTAPPGVVARLQGRRDPRSQAMADYVIAASAAGPDGAAARMRLQDRARTSTDPLLTVLALHMPCVQPGCRNIEASQWSRLEPANLLAWLALPAQAADGSYLLDQISTHARYARDYRQEAASLLDGMPAALALADSWMLLNVRALTGACHRQAADTLLERCETAAELLWRHGGAAERLIALAIGQNVQRAFPQHRATWEPRLRELEAVNRWLNDERTRDDVIPSATPGALCDAMAAARAGDRALTDWERARLALRSAGLSLRDLYPRTRAEARRAPP